MPKRPRGKSSRSVLRGDQGTERRKAILHLRGSGWSCTASPDISGSATNRLGRQSGLHVGETRRMAPAGPRWEGDEVTEREKLKREIYVLGQVIDANAFACLQNMDDDNRESLQGQHGPSETPAAAPGSSSGWRRMNPSQRMVSNLARGASVDVGSSPIRRHFWARPSLPAGTFHASADVQSVVAYHSRASHLSVILMMPL
jgi:hypothetical protein